MRALSGRFCVCLCFSSMLPVRTKGMICFVFVTLDELFAVVKHNVRNTLLWVMCVGYDLQR